MRGIGPRIDSDPSPDGENPLLEKLYARLLRCCSPEFRAEFGEEMLELFAFRLTRSRGRGLLAQARCRIYLFSDLAVTALVTRWQSRPAGDTEAHEKETAMRNLIQDLKYSLRSLAAAPGFTALALLLIGLGVGVNTAMFSIVDALVFKPHPWKQPDRVVFIYQDSDSGGPSSCSYPAFLDMAAHRELFAATAAIIEGRTVSQRLESGLIRQVRASLVTSEYFEVTGLKPLLGLDFDSSHDLVGGLPAALVSHRAWLRDFNADASIVGSQVVLNGTSVTLIGIGPAGYRGATPGSEVDYWLSISAAGPVFGPRYVSTMSTRDDHWFRVLARLQPEVTPAQAQAAMDVLGDRLARDYPKQNAERRITLFRAPDVRIHPSEDDNLEAAAGLLMGIVGLVLLVAAANLGNLLLARSVTRRRELAVRLAMGATRVRLVRLILTEGVLLALGGALLAILLSLGLARVLAAAGPTLPIPLTLEIMLDSRLLLFSLGVAILTTLAFALLPALRATRPDLLPALQDAQATIGRRAAVWWPEWLNLRNFLVIGQISVSLVLIVTAGLLIRSLLNSQEAELGFRVEGLSVMELDAREAGYEGNGVPQFFQQLQRRVEGLPGVEKAIVSTDLPVTSRRSTTTLLVQRDPEGGEVQKAEVPISLVRTDYFSTLGIPFLSGRSFLPEELASYSPVAVINRAFAQQLLGELDAVGRGYRHESQPEISVRVVGVVENSKVRSSWEAPTPMLYRVLPTQAQIARLFLIARTSGDSEQLPPLLRGELQAMDASVPIYQLETLSAHVARSLDLPRWGAQFLAGFGLLALVMAAAGLYSLVSYLASQRRAEMGIRMALGATRAGVVALFLRRMMAVTLIGILLGLGSTVLLRPILQGLLFEVPVLDPPTIGAVVMLMILVTAFATYLPARRASRVDPLKSIRSA